MFCLVSMTSFQVASLEAPVCFYLFHKVLFYKSYKDTTSLMTLLNKGMSWHVGTGAGSLTGSDCIAAEWHAGELLH